MNKYFECGYCGNVINFHHIENNTIIACPACGGLFTEAKEIDNNRAKEILYENIKKGEWDLVEIETSRGKFMIGIGPESVRIRSREYVCIDVQLIRDRHYVGQE